VIAQQGFGLGDKDNTDEQNQAASIKSLILVCVTALVGVVLYFFYNSELKRSNLDKSNNKSTLILD